MTFPHFYFDGNRWFGTVDSDARWCELALAYEGDVQRVLRATKAPRASWLLGAPATRGKDLENFGFRREHVGGVTLAAWSHARGCDLAAVFARGSHA